MIRAFALRPLAFTGALAAAAMLAACGGEPAKPASNFTPVPVTPVIGDVPIGSADAPLEIVEYAALTCHVCRDFAKQIFPRLKATYIDTGKVRFVFRNLPTDPQEIALPGAALARCAVPERFFEVAAALMQGQSAVLRGGNREDWYGPAIAVSGRTQAQIEACTTSPAVEAALARDMDSAEAADVHSTPAFFVNGRRVTDRSLGGLEVAIRAAAAGQ